MKNREENLETIIEKIKKSHKKEEKSKSQKNEKSGEKIERSQKSLKISKSNHIKNWDEMQMLQDLCFENDASLAIRINQ